MKSNLKKIVFSGFLCSLLLASCSKEETPTDAPLNVVSATASTDQDLSQYLGQLTFEYNMEDELIHDIPFDLATAVEPSACGPTAFNDVINASIASNLDALGATYFGLWSTINFLYTLIDPDPQYFGADGEYTNYMVNRTRSLEKFWDMAGEITVRGQHNATLDDRDKIALVYIVFAGLSEADAYANADLIIAINEASTFLIESPLLSFDGFATSGNLIVIGDGIVELLAETGVEDKVVWSGIMAHEWAHQIQFDNFTVWYPDGAADNAPEATRTTELEADFFTGYYLTHKRGATYNWKRAEDFFELFFNIGDCSFTSSGHHGTPIQRMAAAYLGYKLAQSTFPRGHILSADEVHEAFLASLDTIIAGGGM